MKTVSKALALAAFLAMASGAAYAAEAMGCCGEKCACCDKTVEGGDAPKPQAPQHQH